MANTLRVEKFPGLQKLAPANIEARTTESALRDAQYELDLMLHDLRSEFILRESKIRQTYLDRVAQIAAGSEG